MTDRNPFDTLRENPFEDEPETINIYGREFTVEKIEGKYTNYLLRGKRGAVYGATRSIRGHLFLVNLKGIPKVDPLGPVFLTDDNGFLEVIA
jgi:hypothetical protein